MSDENVNEVGLGGFDPVGGPEKTQVLFKLDRNSEIASVIPAHNLYSMPEDAKIGPMTLFKDGTSFDLFEDGRWVVNGRGLNSSGHAKWRMRGFLYFKYITSGHVVDELETVEVLYTLVSHDRHTHRKNWQRVRRGWHDPYKNYWNLINRADIAPYFHIFSNRHSLIVPNQPNFDLEPDVII